MAEDKESIIIDVQVDTQDVAQKMSEAIKAVADLSKEQKQLTKTIQEGNDTNGDAAKRLAAVNASLEENKRAVKSNAAILQAATSERKTENDTLDEQRQYLNTLQKAYGALTKEQKENTKTGQSLAAQIKAVSDSVKEQEAAIGDNRRNVGNYTESIVAAAERTGLLKEATDAAGIASTSFGQATDRLDKTMKLAAKNPWMAVLGLLLPLLQQLLKALMGNEEAMAQVKVLMSALGDVFKTFEPVINAVAKVLTNVLVKAFEVVQKAIGKVLEGIDWLASKFGVNLGLADKFAGGLTDASNEVAETTEENQDREAKAYEDAAKRKKKAMDEFFAHIEEMQNQMQIQNVIDRLLGQADGESNEEWIARMKAKAQSASEALQEALRHEAEDMAAEEDEEDSISVDEMVMRTFGLNEEALQTYKDYLAQGIEATKALQLAQDQVANAGRANFSAMAGSLSDSFAAISDTIGSFAGDCEEAQKAQKAFALAGIVADQAQAISNTAISISESVAAATTAAAATGPGAPFVLAGYIASMTATILGAVAGVASSIQQAKQLLQSDTSAGSYAAGGVIPGTSYVGDKLTARVNSGELILNTRQQGNLLYEIANNGTQAAFNYEAMAQAMAQAVAAQPAPVVVYQELKNFGEQTDAAREAAIV